MTTRFAATRHAALPLGGLALTLLVLPASPSGRHTADLLIAAALLVAGSITSILRLRWQGACAIATAVLLTVIASVDSVNDPANVRWAPIALGPFVVVLAAGAMRAPTRKWWAAFIGAIAAGPARMLVYDPYLDPACRDCPHSAMAITHDPDVARSLLILGTGLTAAALGAIALRRARRWPFLVAAVVAVMTVYAPGVRVVAGGVAVVVIVEDLIHTTTARRRVGILVRAFRQNIDLEQTLRATLGDPTLAVAYWLDDEGRFATRTGEGSPGRADCQITTELRMGGALVAAIHHDSECAEVPALANALDGPARIALENERLAAQLASQARELQRSRTRIVERGDSERHQLERDVHDGAQQHVLALGFAIRTSLAQTPEDDPKRPVLERCLAETHLALDDLRELSHGLYPPSLQAGGLAPALRALARRAPLEVTIRKIPAERWPTPIERAVFALVADASGTATHALDVEIERCGSDLELHILGAHASPGQVVGDRVAALNGRLTSEDSTIRAVIPCAL